MVQSLPDLDICLQYKVKKVRMVCCPFKMSVEFSSY